MNNKNDRADFVAYTPYPKQYYIRRFKDYRIVVEGEYARWIERIIRWLYTNTETFDIRVMTGENKQGKYPFTFGFSDEQEYVLFKIAFP